MGSKGIDLLVYAVSAFGLAWCISNSKISFPLRLRLAELRWTWTLALLECPACTGWWLGIFAYFAGETPSSIGQWWIAGLFTMASNLLLAKLTGLLDEHE